MTQKKKAAANIAFAKYGHGKRSSASVQLIIFVRA